MAESSSIDPRVNAAVTVIAMPQPGQKSVIAAEPDHNLQFTFDVTYATPSREGDDLTLDLDQGRLVTLQNFFSHKAFPLFILEDGIIVDLTDMFDSVDVDFITGPNEDLPSHAGPSAQALSDYFQTPQSLDDFLPPPASCPVNATAPPPGQGCNPASFSSSAVELARPPETADSDPEFVSALIKANTGGTV